MPRSSAASVENQFIGGLVTQATGLNFPENAVTETDNCIFDETGIVSRRLGMDFEASHSLQTANRTNVAVTTYYWKAAAGNGDNSLAVVQIGSTLYFYKQDDAALSDDMIDTIDLTTFSPVGAPSPATVECDFASGNGYLFVSHPDLEPFYVTFDGTTSVTGTEITVEIRDFEGVEDGLLVEERPATLSDLHKYNLYNQGWNTNDVDAEGVGLVNALTFWDTVRSDFPANSDVWWLSKRAVGTYDPTYRAPGVGNSPAPKGHYILTAYEQDRTTASGVPGLTVVSSDGQRPSTIAFFAGRVWYSGITGQEFSNKIYFSQIIESVKQIGWCYQSNDPTSEDRFDLLPSDGGSILIPDAGTILKMVPVENSILIFATNGVWGITGSEGVGFKATDYSIRNVSAAQALSRSSFLSLAGYPSWWNEEGIFVASVDQAGSVQVTSLSDERIKEFYDEIPDNNKQFVTGSFNGKTRVAQWLYRSTSYSDMTEAYTFDRVLNYNLLTKAFYPWSIDSSNVSVNGVVTIRTPGAATKYLCSYPDAGSYEMTFAEATAEDYLDWFTFDGLGVDFTSTLTSGFKVHGEGQRKFQPTLLFIYTKKLETPSVFDFRSQWNYATSGDTGKWSSTQRLTYPDTDYEYQWKRLKVRGHGLALQYRIDSVTGQPFNIIGWSAFETGNTQPT